MTQESTWDTSGTAQQDASQIIKQGRDLAEKREFRQAETLLRELLRRDERNPAALYELATILSWDGQYDESVASYRRLLTLQPESTGLHLEIGRVLLWQADRSGEQEYRRAAIREFETRVTQSPTDCFAMKQIGAAYLRLGALDTAYSQLLSLSKLCPDDDEALRLLAETCVARKNFGEAVQLLRKLVLRIPGNPDVRWELADVLIQAGEIDLAEKEFRIILARNQYHSGALIGLARVLQWKGEPDKAKDCYQSAALWTTIKNPAPLLGLGNVEATQGHWRTAVEHYRNALLVDPHNDEAESGLRQAQWMIGPRLNCEYTDFQASQGLSQRMITAEAGMDFPDRGTWAVGYRSFRFVQDYVPDLFRTDLYLSWTLQVTDWLISKLQGTASDFSGNPNDADKLYGWSADVIVSPIPAAKLYLTYARVPATESNATINSHYHSDVLAAGVDAKVSQRLSVQMSGSIARYDGTFSTGYWDSYHARWVVLKVLPDLSQHQRVEAQVSYRFSVEPIITVRAGTSLLKTIQSEYLPYWAPLSFPCEKIALSIAKSTSGRLDFNLEGRITHVHEGHEWGYGVSGSLTFRLWNVLELGTSGSIEKMGTEVPWDGKSIGAVLRIHYSDW